MKPGFSILLAFIGASALVACGEDLHRTDYRSYAAESPMAEAKPDTHEWVTRGEWSMPIALSDGHLMLATDRPQVIQVRVAPKVRFVVSEFDLADLADAESETALGSLSVERLRDNSLRQCGDSGKDPCTVAAIQLYTEGADGEGLWNQELGFGLPLSITGTPIGIGAENAATAASTGIADLRVLHLHDFGGVKLPIEVRADFSDAAAGEYRTNLVVRYAVR